MKTKAVRIDPGMFYPHYTSAAAATQHVLADLHRWGANTAFIFAASPIYGPYYQTQHPNLGKSTRFPGPDSYLRGENFLAVFANAAQRMGIRVIASFRMNQYQRLAEANPTWRSRVKDGDYVTRIYGDANWLWPLSAHVPGYRQWFGDMLQDVLIRIPELSGLDACEGNVAEGAEEGDGMPDRRLAIPGPVGSQNWREARADAMTELHSILLQACAGRESHFVHDLSVRKVGQQWNLTPGKAYAAGCGFDFDDIVGLGYTHPCLSAIWQQREGEYPGNFGPQFTANAADEFGHRYPGRTLLTHVEATNFAGIRPNPVQFGQAVKLALAHSSGVTVYSYDQMKEVKGGAYVDSAYGTQLAAAFATA